MGCAREAEWRAWARERKGADSGRTWSVDTERAGQPRKVFAANHKVGLAALQYWICKLRREVAAANRQSAPSELRLVPARVDGQAAVAPERAGRVKIRLGGFSIRVPLGTDPRYLASVVADDGTLLGGGRPASYVPLFMRGCMAAPDLLVPGKASELQRGRDPRADRG